MLSIYSFIFLNTFSLSNAFAESKKDLVTFTEERDEKADFCVYKVDLQWEKASPPTATHWVTIRRFQPFKHQTNHYVTQPRKVIRLLCGREYHVYISSSDGFSKKLVFNYPDDKIYEDPVIEDPLPPLAEVEKEPEGPSWYEGYDKVIRLSGGATFSIFNQDDSFAVVEAQSINIGAMDFSFFVEKPSHRISLEHSNSSASVIGESNTTPYSLQTTSLIGIYRFTKSLGLSVGLNQTSLPGFGSIASDAPLTSVPIQARFLSLGLNHSFFMTENLWAEWNFLPLIPVSYTRNSNLIDQTMTPSLLISTYFYYAFTQNFDFGLYWNARYLSFEIEEPLSSVQAIMSNFGLSLQYQF